MQTAVFAIATAKLRHEFQSCKFLAKKIGKKNENQEKREDNNQQTIAMRIKQVAVF
ncbi:MAG: hypothetical protein J6Y87_02825 [Muribaculaceae bacterium]|nr:hypothetical protein [Muribaculaceae bacterium]